MEGPQKTKNRTTIWSSVTIPGHITRNVRQHTITIHTSQCLLKHNTQKSSYGISLGVDQPKNE
jgi:hypothetical protein